MNDWIQEAAKGSRLTRTNGSLIFLLSVATLFSVLGPAMAEGRLLYMPSAPLASGCRTASSAGGVQPEKPRCRTTSAMLSVLRDPRLLPTWNRETWQRAITQMRAYQELFSGTGNHNGDGGMAIDGSESEWSRQKKRRKRPKLGTTELERTRRT